MSAKDLRLFSTRWREGGREGPSIHSLDRRVLFDIDIVPSFIDDATKEGRKKEKKKEKEKDARRQASEESEKEVKSCREWRRVTHARGPPSFFRRSQIRNVVKCVTDA